MGSVDSKTVVGHHKKNYRIGFSVAILLLLGAIIFALLFSDGEASLIAWVDKLPEIIANNSWLIPFFAFLAGVLTSFTPCSLSTIPLIITYVGGTKERNAKRAFWLSLTFAGGATCTFVIMGAVASLAERLMHISETPWHIFLGVLMLLMALQTWGVINLIPHRHQTIQEGKQGFGGAFLAGILAGIFSSHCSIPVIITLLAIAAVEQNLAFGALLLLLYSLGHGALAILAGTSIGFAQKLSCNANYGKANFIFKLILGSIIFIIGIYMLISVFYH